MRPAQIDARVKSVVAFLPFEQSVPKRAKVAEVPGALIPQFRRAARRVAVFAKANTD